ncbi:hypothetical protein LXL04_024264 [Taraxacum kok-saghyz]
MEVVRRITGRDYIVDVPVIGRRSSRKLQEKIRGWKRGVKEGRLKLKLELATRLEYVDNRIDNRMVSDDIIGERRDVLKQMTDIDTVEGLDYGQKTMKTYVNFWVVILWEWVDDLVRIKDISYEFYATKFKFFSVIPVIERSSSFGHLSMNEMENIQKQVMDVEIKEVVPSCGGDRAQTTDGFTFRFINTYREMLKGKIFPPQKEAPASVTMKSDTLAVEHAAASDKNERICHD